MFEGKPESRTMGYQKRNNKWMICMFAITSKTNPITDDVIWCIFRQGAVNDVCFYILGSKFNVLEKFINNVVVVRLHCVRVGCHVANTPFFLVFFMLLNTLSNKIFKRIGECIACPLQRTDLINY